MTYEEVYIKSKKILKNISSARNDLNIIFEHYFGINRIDLMFKKDDVIKDEKTVINFFEAISKRAKNEPLQYILGQWNFMNLNFKVGPGVLIPREDTEVLVKYAAEYLKNVKNPKIVDLCSGTGCIAINLENILKNPEIYAIELFDKAFYYLNENIKINSSKIHALKKNVLEDIKLGFFDAVISNPPYIKSENLKKLQKEIKKEPQTALDGGEDGLYFYKKICGIWISKLKPEGLIAFEVGVNQSKDVIEIMNRFGVKNINTKKDINGIERVVYGIK